MFICKKTITVTVTVMTKRTAKGKQNKAIDCKLTLVTLESTYSAVHTPEKGEAKEDVCTILDFWLHCSLPTSHNVYLEALLNLITW